MKSITLASQNFSKRAGRVKLPYIDQLAGFYLFGGSAAASLTNLAYGASQNLSAIATPTYGAGYATIDATNGFDTGLLLDTPFTQLVVAKHTVAGGSLAMFCRGTGNADNFVDMLRLNDANTQLDGWPDGNLGQAFTGMDSSGYRMYGQSWGGTGTRHLVFAMVGTSLTYAVSSVNVTKTTTPTHNIRLGVGNNSGSPVMRVPAAALAAKVLSMQQIYEIGTYLRALLATRGITML